MGRERQCHPHRPRDILFSCVRKKLLRARTQVTWCWHLLRAVLGTNIWFERWGGQHHPSLDVGLVDDRSREWRDGTSAGVSPFFLRHREWILSSSTGRAVCLNPAAPSRASLDDGGSRSEATELQGFALQQIIDGSRRVTVMPLYVCTPR